MVPSVRICLAALVGLALATPAHAQADMPAMPGMHDMQGMDHAGMTMEGPLGVGHSRHASGTAWLPDESPMRVGMWHRKGWMLMLHGQLFGQYIQTTGDRGDSQFGSANWIMLMATHDAAGGQVTGRAMVSGERVTVGICGYPDLGQTGPVCGEKVRDLQHPHDLFMELGADYKRAIGENVAVEIYGGPAGEPALGPPAFPHRISALPNLSAPITHHWLDVTHISFGVVTGGIYGRRWKAEASAFNGRHPDDRRYGLDLAPLNSSSGRMWFLPTPRWAIQASVGRIRAPEGHNHTANAPNVSTIRTTASATYHRMLGSRVWATTVAWGQNAEPSVTTGGALAETAVDVSDRNTLFGRAELLERTAADTNVSTLDVETYLTSKLEAGYMRAIVRAAGIEGTIGGTAGVALVPETISFVYGGRASAEFSVFFALRPTVH